MGHWQISEEFYCPLSSIVFHCPLSFSRIKVLANIRRVLLPTVLHCLPLSIVFQPHKSIGKYQKSFIAHSLTLSSIAHCLPGIVGKKRDHRILDPLFFSGKIRKNRKNSEKLKKIRKNTFFQKN